MKTVQKTERNNGEKNCPKLIKMYKKIKGNIKKKQPKIDKNLAKNA